MLTNFDNFAAIRRLYKLQTSVSRASVLRNLDLAVLDLSRLVLDVFWNKFSTISDKNAIKVNGHSWDTLFQPFPGTA